MNINVSYLLGYNVEINIIFGVLLLICFGVAIGLGNPRGVWVKDLPVLPNSLLIISMTLWLWCDQLESRVTGGALFGYLSFGLVLTLVSILFLGLFLSKQRKGEQYFEYSILVLLGTLGIDLLLMADNFVSFFIGLEPNSTCLYVLAGYDIRSARSRRAGIEYFVLGTFSSMIFLFGVAILYMFTCFFAFSDYHMLAAQGVPEVYQRGVVTGALLCMLGLAFKVYRAPFHSWVMDVYCGAPWSASLYIAGVSPLAVMYALRRIQIEVFAFCYSEIVSLICALCCLTLLIGSCGGVGERDIRRILGYSSITNTGFYFASIVVDDLAVQLIGCEYLFLYATTVLALVLIFHNCSTESDTPETIDWLVGLCATNRKLACFLVFFFSLLGGLPPFSLSMLKFTMSAVFYTKFQQIVFFVALGASIINLFVYFRFLQNVYHGADRKRRVDEPSPVLPYGIEVLLFCLAAFQLGFAFIGASFDAYFYIMVTGI
jgi:NADH-quinone oxidoreductase subunit N